MSFAFNQQDTTTLLRVHLPTGGLTARGRAKIGQDIRFKKQMMQMERGARFVKSGIFFAESHPPFVLALAVHRLTRPTVQHLLQIAR